MNPNKSVDEQISDAENLFDEIAEDERKRKQFLHDFHASSVSAMASKLKGTKFGGSRAERRKTAREHLRGGK